MARPNKQGLDYFPLNTDISKDDKIALIEAKHGLIGFGVIIKLYEKIYCNKGYYYEWNGDTQLLFSKQVGLEVEKVVEIINDAIKWNLFDEKLFKKYKILTSRRIQTTFLEATKRRKEIPMIQKYLLNGVNGYINEVNTNIILINDDINSQTEKEIETETESKEKKTPPKIKYADFVSLTEEEYQKLVSEYGEEKTQAFIEKLNNAKGAKGYKYKSDYRAILNWVIDVVLNKGGASANNRGSVKRFENEREYSDDEQRRIEEKFYV